jgi:exo-beta-1,3-glucanase (GH17 family)
LRAPTMKQPGPCRVLLAALLAVSALASLAACSSTNGSLGPIGPEQGDATADSIPPGGDDMSPSDAGGDARKPKDGSVPEGDGGVPEGGLRRIPAAVLARHALCYSGYRANEDPTAMPPTYPTEAEVTQDLKVLVQGGWTFLRLYACDQASETTLKAIRDNNLDIKVMQGVWNYGDKATSDADNQAEIQRCLALNATYGDIIAAFSLGNETLDAWTGPQTHPADLAAYIKQFRAKVTQPVTTDDFFGPFSLGGDTLPDGGPYSYSDVIKVLEAVDFLAVHTYPFIDAPYQSWDYQQVNVAAGPQRAVAMMNAAQAYNEANIASVQQALAAKNLDRPIVIGETGWKSKANPNCVEVSMAHPVNQKMFYEAEVAWVYGSKKTADSPLALFFFEGSDEPWKQTDDNWGLFDTNRYAKYVVWDQFPGMKPPGAPNYTAADAVYYKTGDPTNPPP